MNLKQMFSVHFTSGMIIKKLRERDGIEIDTVDEALENYIKAVKQIFLCPYSHYVRY